MKSIDTKFNKSFFIFVLCLLVSQFSYSQSSSTRIEIDAINDSLFVFLIQSKTDSVRIHHKTVALNPDSNLQKAATNHVNYVMQQGTLTHFQAGSRQLYDPFDRAVFYKAAFGTVGENIAFTYIGKLTKSNYGKPHTNFTYEEVADDLVKMWKHSAEHFKNLTEKEFTHSGIAIAFSYKEQALYAVQVYGGNKKK